MCSPFFLHVSTLLPATRYVIVRKISTDLYPMIVSVGYDELSNPIHSNTSQAVKLSFSVTVATKFFLEYPV